MIASFSEILTYMQITATATAADIALLNMMLGKAEAAVKTYLQNDIEYASHVEYLPAGARLTERDVLVDAQIHGNRVNLVRGSNANQVLQLKHTPVWLADMEVREDSNAYGGQSTDAFASSTILTRGIDYYLDVNEELDGVPVSRTGHLRRIGSWSIMPKSIKVTYKAGWTAAHLDGVAANVKGAVIKTVVKAIGSAKAMKGGVMRPIISETIGKTSTTYSASLVSQLLLAASSLPPEAIGDLQAFRNYGRLVI